MRWDIDHLGQHPTDIQLTKIAERGASLRRRLTAWFQAQDLHIPAARILRSRHKTSAHSTAAEIPLFLPSQIYDADVSCPDYLLKIEWHLRFAQAMDSLELLRKLLLSRTAIITYKKQHTHGQREGTKSSEALTHASEKIGACAARYRLHRQVAVRFASGMGFIGVDDVLKPLTDSDIRGINGNAMDCDQRESETSLSWIWKSLGPESNSDAGIAEGEFQVYFLSNAYHRCSQHYEFHGVKLAHVLIDGKRSVYCCRRRCGEPWRHSKRKQRFGTNEVLHCYQICLLRWYRVGVRMPGDRDQFVGRWRITVVNAGYRG